MKSGQADATTQSKRNATGDHPRDVNSLTPSETRKGTSRAASRVKSTLSAPSALRLALALFLLVLSAPVLLSPDRHVYAVGPNIVSDRNITLDGQNDDARGIWSDGDIMWVLDVGNDVIYAYRLSTGARVANRDIDLASANGNGQGIWSDGTTMYVVDWDDTWVYAYRLSDGVRQSSKEFNLTGSNDGPRGMWGDTGATTLWIVDKDDTYAYAYNYNTRNRRSAADFDLHDDIDNPWGLWGDSIADVMYISNVDNNRIYAQTFSTSGGSSERRNRLEFLTANTSDDIRGIWSDGTIMWTADEEDSRLNAVEFGTMASATGPGGQSRILMRAANDEPAGLWDGGGKIWVVDYDDNKAYAHFKFTGNESGSMFDTGASWSTRGIWGNTDEDIVWISTGQNWLRAFDFSDTSRKPSEDIQLTANNGVQGIWGSFDEDLIWTVDSGAEDLVAYRISNGNYVASRSFALTAVNQDPRGIWSDGTFVWVVDHHDDRVYAYNLASGSREFELEFDLIFGHDNAWGITGDSSKFWISDLDDDRLYPYLIPNRPPIFDEPGDADVVLDDATANGTEVYDADATDPEGDTIEYSLAGQFSHHFSINKNTGVITIESTSRLAPGVNTPIKVVTTDKMSRLHTPDNAEDTTKNVNFRAVANFDPTFDDGDSTTVSVPENSAASTDVGSPIDATDTDGDDLEFAIDGTSDEFEIVTSTGQIRVKSGAELDYETTEQYTLTVTVTDNKDESGSNDSTIDDEIEVTVNVTNVNEDGSVTLSANRAQVGTEIDGTAHDPDEILYAPSWTIHRGDSATGPWTQVKSCATSPCALTPTTADQLKYLRFVATYTDTFGSSTAEAVTDQPTLPQGVANQPPTFNQGASTSRSIAEDASAGANVGAAVTASDTENDTLTYGLIGTDATSFNINSSTGQIQLKSPTGIDYETKSSYVVQVRVRDSKDATTGNTDTAWDATINVTISISNVNEAGEVTLTPASPRENESVTASLTDGDGSISNLTWAWYRATTNTADGTAITNATSASYTPVSADVGNFLRAVASYTDGYGSNQSADAHTSSAVAARASNVAPDFVDGASTTRQVNEGAGSGTFVGSAISANDGDSDTLTYSLSTGQDSNLFTVETGTGRLKVAAGADIDYETDNTLQVTLNVTDGKASDHSTDNAVDDSISVTITVNNVEEEGRVDLSTPHPQDGATITATLTDPDGGIVSPAWQWQTGTDPEGQTWTNISGENSAGFTPSASHVGLYLRATVTYEDTLGPNKQAQQSSANAVLAAIINNSPPAFDEGSSATRSVGVEAAVNDPVGDEVSATDPDAADDLTYGIDPSGDFASSFDINEDTGQILVAADLDNLSGETVILTLRVRDSKDQDGTADTAWDHEIQVRILLTARAIVNDPPEFVDGASVQRSMPANTVRGGAFDIPLRANDVNGDDLTYGLRGLHAGLFEIDPTTGQLKLIAGVRLELGDRYELIVLVRDSVDEFAVQDEQWDDQIALTVVVTQAIAGEHTQAIRITDTRTGMIMRIEPSISEIVASPGDKTRLWVEVYGRQNILDQGLADNVDVIWKQGDDPIEGDGTVILYVAPAAPGTYRITATIGAKDCRPEFEEDRMEHCTATFYIKVLRRAEIPVETPTPLNPAGEIPTVIADANGQQYAVFTPVDGGRFEGEGFWLNAEPGTVPSGELLGVRMTQGEAATSDVSAHHRFVLGGNWYTISAVTQLGEPVSDYALAKPLRFCIPLPPELRANVADLVIASQYENDEPTILSASVFLGEAEISVCGGTSLVPAKVIVATVGAPPPEVVESSEHPTEIEAPSTGGWVPIQTGAYIWALLIGLTSVVLGLAVTRVRSRHRRIN